jgi:putative flippase GtrA
MPEELGAVEIRSHVRVLHGLRKPANWYQLVRFGVVGAIGFILNLGVYALFVHPLGVEYHVSAALAWLVAVTNNFILNRHWTFDARDHDLARFQAMRFFVVSLCAFGASQLVLTLLVEGGFAKVPAQALAVAGTTPLNFLGNKLWSFRAKA